MKNKNTGLTFVNSYKCLKTSEELVDSLLITEAQKRDSDNSTAITQTKLLKEYNISETELKNVTAEIE